jgi:iron-sulfur cluster assembly protein
MSRVIHLSDNAVRELGRRLAGGPGGAAVRVGLRPGGCAGAKYVVEIVAERGEDECVFEQDGLPVLCAASDLPHLDGLRVDYVEAIVGGGFQFDNPNAVTRCACGQSFAAD